jgi:hypothetical membrane protein
MNEEKINIEEKAEDVYDLVTKWIKDNYSYNEIKQFVMDGGLDEATAKEVLAQVGVLRKKKAKEEMRHGALIMLVGVVIAAIGIIFPFHEISPTFHIIFYGPIIVGAGMFFRGQANSK